MMLNTFRLFIDIVKLANLSQVAAKWQLSKSQVSRKLTKLEEDIGSQLVQRSTRRLSLTESGQIFYQSCQHLVALWDESLEAIQEGEKNVSGDIRLTAPSTWGNTIIVPAVAAFSRKYPDINFTLDLTASIRDMHQYDVAIRSIKQLPDSNLHARELLRYDYILCGSQEYLDSFGTPRTVDELSQHRCIHNVTHDPGKRHYEWTFKSGSKIEKVRLSSHFQVSNYAAQADLVTQGLGLARLPAPFAKPLIDSGKLIELLPQYDKDYSILWLVFPHHGPMPKRIRLLIDYLINNIS